MVNLFVYGSLQFPEMIKGITGCIFQSEPAVLEHYKRYSVKGESYPAIVEAPRESVTGMVFFDVGEDALNRISFFEGEEYVLKEVDVICFEQIIKAQTFCWIANRNFLSNEEWDKRKFESESLPFYLKEVLPELRKYLEENDA